MFGSSATPSKDGEAAVDSSSNDPKSPIDPSNPMAESAQEVPGSPTTNRKSTDDAGNSDRKRRSSGVAKAKDIFASAKSSFHVHSVVTQSEKDQTPIQRLSKADPALGVPQGSLNNSAGDSMPGPRSTFRVGVTEDKNKKCRRTMEDTHAYLYNFLSTPQASSTTDVTTKTEPATNPTEQAVAETDNGYFAIFDGHAGTFAADWCGKKLHLILEDTIRRNPSTPIPELLDQTFTSVDQQLEKLPVKSSGCTAVIAVLRWEDRVPNNASATGSTYLNQAAAKVSADSGPETATVPEATTPAQAAEKLKDAASRQRVLYTANVGDARIVLCRNGRALRLSYDHKGSDEQEGRRVSNAGGLILNNRVNGVLAVTRALGDSYMKDLVTGHPYTTETVIQHETDEFMILACDGLWDVCSDQEAVDLIRNIHDPQAASKQLVDHALARFSTDNLSCMVVRYDNKALKALKDSSSIGVEGDPDTIRGSVSEADAIVSSVKRLQDETGEAGVEKIGAHTANDMIVEEEEGHNSSFATKPVPELNAEAVEKAKKNKVAS